MSFCASVGMSWTDKQKHPANATLELHRVPPDMNNIAEINEHFARFGTLVHVQVGIGALGNLCGFEVSCLPSHLHHVSEIAPPCCGL